MQDFINITEDHESDSIAISVDIGDEDILRIGNRLNEICDEAYMNGYNWEALLNAFLTENAPELLEDLESDSEAELYSACYTPCDKNRVKAHQLATLISTLTEQPDQLYHFVETNGDEIEWD